MNRDLKHPVWGVYDLYRVVKLNVEYYSEKLYKAERLNSLMEFIILIAAPSSAVAGLWFWEHPIGKEFWKYLGAIAAFTIIFKQAFQLTKKMKDYSNTLVNYKSLEQDLFVLVELIKSKENYTEKHVADYERALKKKASISANSPDGKIDTKLKKRCQSIVNKKLPPETFWVPILQTEK